MLIPTPESRVLQVHKSYLVTQDEMGMVIIDQHALHERVLYEQLRERTANKSLESQRLLMPEPIDLSPAEAAAAIEFRDVLAYTWMVLRHGALVRELAARRRSLAEQVIQAVQSAEV